MFFPNELVFVLMIVTEVLFLHSKYEEIMWRAAHSTGYSIMLFKGTDFDWDGLFQKSHFC